jgi:hypothetical protein
MDARTNIVIDLGFRNGIPFGISPPKSVSGFRHWAGHCPPLLLYMTCVSLYIVLVQVPNTDVNDLSQPRQVL